MTINKNADLEFSIQQNTEKGGVYTNFYTEDKGSASIRIRLSSNGYYLDLTKTDLKPVLFLFHEDGSIFEIKDFMNVMPEQGLIQYNFSDNVIRHAGKVKAKVFLKNDTKSVHVANFTFDIKDSGIEGAVGKEIKVELLEDIVRNVITDNAMELLDDEYKEKINQDVVDYVASNPDKYKGEDGKSLKYADLSTSEKEDLKSNITDQAVTDFVLEDGTVTTSKLDSNTVAMEKTDFLESGKNIFRLNNVIKGKTVSPTTGELIDSQYFVASDFEPIIANITYTQNFGEAIAYYDINKKFISGLSKASNVKTSRTFTTPSNAYYIRTSVVDEGVDTYSYKTYQIESGNQSTSYEPFYLKIHDFKAEIPNDSIKNSHIINNSITLDKLSVTRTSQNIFDKSKATSGNYVNPTTGSLSANANYFYSDYINIENSTKLTKSTANNLYAFYDINKQFVTNTNTSTKTIDVPNGAVYVRFSVLNSNIDTEMLVKGDTLPSSYIPYKVFIPNEYIEETSKTEEIPDNYGKQNLKTYVADISKQLNPDANTRAEIAFIGDSWVEGGAVKKGERLTLPLREKMKSIYTDGGIGFIGLANSHIGNGAVSVTLTGSWTHYDEGLGNIAQSKGLDSAMVESETAGDSIKVQFYEDVDYYEIHTLNTGSYRYNIDGGSWITVDATQQEVTEIPLTLGKHIINIEIVSGKVAFVGSYAYKGDKGVVIHKIGNGGLKASHIASTDRTNWVKQLKRCKANTFGILLGTNDMAQNVPLSDYERDMKEVISRIKEAKPLASIFLIAPSGNKYDNNVLHTIENYSDKQYKIAKELNIAHVSLFRNLGDYATTNANGLMYTDGVHPNVDGGYAISNVVYDRLLRI